MSAVSLISRAPRPEAPAARVDPPLLGTLEQLRSTARRLRLHATCDTSALGVLLDRLPSMLGCRMVFHEPGAQDVSFDEAWVLNLLDAVRMGDEDRYRFALLSRMRRDRASALHFLVCQAAHTLDMRS